MVRLLIYFFIIAFGFWVQGQSSFDHQFQINATLAIPLDDSGTVSPVTGTQNVRVEVINMADGQPIWSESKPIYVDQGQLSVLVSDPAIDWVEKLTHHDLSFRVFVLDDLIEMPFQFLPFSILSDQSDIARQFKDETLLNIDYKNQRLAINQSSSNASLAVDGTIQATYFIGNGGDLTNLTGPGFNDGHSLNSLNGQFKDVVFVSNSANVGIHTDSPLARLHIKGSVVFKSDESNILSNYLVPSGSVLLWDDRRASFRSGIFSDRTSSIDIGRYSVGFGEDILAKADYSAILGGEDHEISKQGIFSVVLGGQGHTIESMNSVIGGGFNNTVRSEWSVIFSGRNHEIIGEYNVILGGQANAIDGYLDTLFGRDNEVIGDRNLIMGSNHSVTGKQNTVLGRNITATGNLAFIYSDGQYPIDGVYDSQLIIHSKNGVGINAVPAKNTELTVSGNIKSTTFYGDGRYLTNIIEGQDLWSQEFQGGQRKGVYYTGGPVSIGTLDNAASLTVSGGITIQETVQSSSIENGTIHYSQTDGLQFYHNGWINIDSQDSDTTLRPGYGFRLSGRTFDLDGMAAEPIDVLNYNGSKWVPLNKEFWKSFDSGIYTHKSVSLATQNPSTQFPLSIQSDAADSETRYALVMSGADRLAFSPQDQQIMINLDFSDDAKSSYVMANGQGTYGDQLLFGSAIVVSENQLRFLQTAKPLLNGETATFSNPFTVTPTSAYTTDVPKLTFDFSGSIEFLNTQFDKLPGQPGLANKRINMPSSQYFFLSQRKDLHLNAGLATASAPIKFNIDQSTKAYFDEQGQFIIGDGVAHEKLSIHGGGVALGVAGSTLSSSRKDSKQFKIHSVSNEDPSIYFMQNNQMIMDIGHQTLGIGRNNSVDTLLNTKSINGSLVTIQSNNASKLILDHGSGYTFENNMGRFSFSANSKPSPFISIKDKSRLAFLTSHVADADQSLVINGDIGFVNDADFLLQTEGKQTLLKMSKSGNALQLKQSAGTVFYLTNLNQDKSLMTLFPSQQLAINSDQPSSDATLYVNGDTVFNESIFYQESGPSLIQAFTLSTTADNADDVKEFRSIKSLIIDESSGLSVALTPASQQIELFSPDYYNVWYETPLMDGNVPVGGLQFIQPNGKDVLELKEVYPNGGVSINAIDTDTDGIVDSIELYNPLIDGGLIEGTITLNGELYVNGTDANGSEVQSIPFRWQKVFSDLVYSSGNVGIDTMSPQFDLDVASTMRSKELAVYDEAIVQSINVDLNSKASVQKDIALILDKDDNQSADQLMVNFESSPMFSVVPQELKGDGRIGFFTATPQSDIHFEQANGPASVQLKSLSSGQPEIGFFTKDDSKSGAIKLNLDLDLNDFGKISDAIFSAERHIDITTAGSDDPALYIRENSVALASEETANTLYVPSTMGIGNSFAGNVRLNSATGLNVQGRLSVGHESVDSTGATVYVKNALLVGDTAHSLMPSDFKGVLVEGGLGIGTSSLMGAISLQGGFKLKDKMSFYNDETRKFEIKPRKISVVPSSYGLNFQVSKSMNYSVSLLDKKVLSVVPGSVVFGQNDEPGDNNLFFQNSYGGSKLLLDSTQSQPRIEFTNNAGAGASTIGLKSVSGTAQLVIESAGTDLSNPDIVISPGKVGFGKTPAAAMDVNGTLKSENLYLNKKRLYPVPYGTIMMWSGSGDLPSGWQFCDGTNGTPNLKNKFIKGTTLDGMNQTGGKNDSSVTGGAHTHSGSGGHEHAVVDGSSGTGDHKHSASVHYSKFNETNGTTPSHTAEQIRGTGSSGTVYLPTSHLHSFYVSSQWKSNHNHSLDQTSAGVHHKTTEKGQHDHGGGAHTHTWDNQPPYYVLAFIMKVSPQ